MTVRKLIHVKDIEEPPQQEKGQSHRRTTDKYWMGLFFVLLIIWIIWMAIASQQCPTSRFGRIMPPIANNGIENMLLSIIPNPLPSDYMFWGKNWIFDMITCNVAYLEAHYLTSGPIVIWANALFFIGLLVYSIRSIMNSDEGFNWQFAIAGPLFFMSTLSLRLTYIIANFQYSTILLSFIPEGIFLIIWLKRPRGNVRIQENFARVILCIFSWYLIILAIFFISFEIFGKMTYGLGSCSSLLYNVNYGIVFYCVLTIIYLIQMASLPLEGVTFFTVAKYHFGTACYHATLIFPKLKTLLVIMEPEFKGNPNTTIIDRLSLINGKINRMSLLTTAATGMDHSEFIRKLLRLPAGRLPTLQPYRYFITINTALLAFLLSTNSLMLMSLWALGYFDPSVSMITYIYNLANFFMHYVVIVGVDASLNTAFLFDTKEEITPNNPDNAQFINEEAQDWWGRLVCMILMTIGKPAGVQVPRVPLQSSNRT